MLKLEDRVHTTGEEEAQRTTRRIEVSTSSKEASIQVSVLTLELVYKNSSIMIFDIKLLKFLNLFLLRS